LSRNSDASTLALAALALTALALSALALSALALAVGRKLGPGGQ
jgi:hypothetical protein